MQAALLESNDALWENDQERQQLAFELLNDIAERTAGAARIRQALVLLDGLVLRNLGRLPSDPVAELGEMDFQQVSAILATEVATFAADGDANETTRYLLQGVLARMAFLARSGQFQAATDLLLRLPSDLAVLPPAHPVRRAAEALADPSNVGKDFGQRLGPLWQAAFASLE